MDKNDLNEQIQETIEVLILCGCNKPLLEGIDYNLTDGNEARFIYNKDDVRGTLPEAVQKIFKLRILYLSIFDQLSVDDITCYSEKINQINKMYEDIREFYRLGEMAKFEALEKYWEDKRKKSEKE